LQHSLSSFSSFILFPLVLSSSNPGQQEIRNKKKVKICDKQYASKRQQFVEIGAEAQEWILRYFIQSPDVNVFNRDHFIQALEATHEFPVWTR
jgi:hypothetical protein